MKQLVVCIGLALALASGCKDDDKVQPLAELYEVIVLSTNYGTMYLRLYDETPKHKANFDSLVRSGFYDSTEFHRCVDDFVIQGGSPTSKDNDRTNDASGSLGYTIPAEIDTPNVKHFYGALAAARLGDITNPERRSSGSQFYIVTAPDGASFLDGSYTVFGEILAGMHVVKTIESQPKNRNGLPNERIKMVIKYAWMSQKELLEKGIVL